MKQLWLTHSMTTVQTFHHHYLYNNFDYPPIKAATEVARVDWVWQFFRGSSLNNWFGGIWRHRMVHFQMWLFCFLFCWHVQMCQQSSLPISNVFVSMQSYNFIAVSKNIATSAIALPVASNWWWGSHRCKVCMNFDVW